MTGPWVSSDQFDNWSEDDLARHLYHGPETQAPGPGAPPAPAHRAPPGFAHRALQALWQPRLQVCHGSGARTKYYLSISHTKSSPTMDYVPQEYQEQAAHYLANYRLVRDLLEEICQINRELLRRRERL